MRQRPRDPGRDLRRYMQQTTVQLVIGGFIILVVVGLGLVYWIYGPSAAVSGLLCLGIGIFPLFIIGIALFIMEWIVKHANRQ